MRQSQFLSLGFANGSFCNPIQLFKISLASNITQKFSLEKLIIIIREKLIFIRHKTNDRQSARSSEHNSKLVGLIFPEMKPVFQNLAKFSFASQLCVKMHIKCIIMYNWHVCPAAPRPFAPCYPFGGFCASSVNALSMHSRMMP